MWHILVSFLGRSLWIPKSPEIKASIGLRTSGNGNLLHNSFLCVFWHAEVLDICFFHSESSYSGFPGFWKREPALISGFSKIKKLFSKPLKTKGRAGFSMLENSVWVLVLETRNQASKLGHFWRLGLAQSGPRNVVARPAQPSPTTARPGPPNIFCRPARPGPGPTINWERICLYKQIHRKSTYTSSQ